jgi:tRNA (uracil-5-)-methyltransferase TRM9
MLLRPDNFIGCDNCKNFINICKKRNLNVILSCATKLPFKSNNFDATLSVAVLHHLSTSERRMMAIKEQIRVTKIGGIIFIEVWAFESNNRVKDNNQDNFVPWKFNEKVFQRFYHFFKKKEIITIIEKIKNVELLSINNEKYNWIVILKKLF